MIRSEKTSAIDAVRLLLILSGLLSFFAVATGAFGAHILQERITPDMLRTFETGVKYHFYHALGLGLLALARDRSGPSRLMAWASGVMLTGIFLFSGSLYLLVLSGKHWPAAITPIGGTALLAAWVLFVLGLFKDGTG